MNSPTNKKSRLKIEGRQRTRLTRKQIVILSTGLFLMLVGSFTIFINLRQTEKAYAAVNGEYRSAGSGAWNLLTTWQKYSGGAWGLALTVPDSTSNIITIQSGHTVTATANFKADQVVVSSGATLVINSGVTFTVANGTATDLDVSGTVTNAGTITKNPSATINFKSSGKYQHNYTTTAGTIPGATWTSGSTCEIIGYTSNASAPSGFQSFSNFTWNCPSQNKDLVLNGGLMTVNGILNIVSTGSKSLTLAAANSTLSVGGDLNMSGGNVVLQSQSGGTYTLTVGGNINHSGGTFTALNNSNSRATVNLTGNLNISAGTWSVASNDNTRSTLTISGNYSQSGGANNMLTGKNSSVTTTLTGNFSLTAGTLDCGSQNNDTTVFNLRGNYSHTGGTLSMNSSSSSYAQMIFSKTGRQTFTASVNTVTGNVDFRVNNNSILSFGTNVMTGRDFTLFAGGEIEIGSPAGITSTSASGNVQCTTRSFNTGADYVYNGSSAQAAGDGLPATVRDLTLNNSNGLTIAANVAVSGILTFTAGKITTGSNELQVTNASTTSISGYSNAKYVIGNLRRTVNASGTYDFPLGTAAYYEILTLKLTSTSGFSSVLAGFTSADPLNPSYPLSNITVSGVDMSDLLDYGYWSLAPNTPMTGGSFNVDVDEQGFTNSIIDGNLFSLLTRLNSSSAWTSSGTHSDNTQSYSGGIVAAARTTMNTFGDYAIGFGDFPAFTSSSLQSGTDGQIGAIYIFPNVMRGVDAWVEILDKQGGATLDNIDDQSTGYKACFQPFINYAPTSDGYFDWKIRFKKNGTSTDTTLRKLTATGVDVDGGVSSGKTIREYIEATMPTSYSLDPATTLTITNNSGRYRATGSTVTVSNIDTTAHEAMYELYYTNVNSIYYRTGATSTYTSNQIRQTSLYFKSFNLSVRNIALPIKLMYFNAQLRNEIVELDWATAAEINNDFFTVEKSTDGISFEPVLTMRGAGNSTSTLTYSATDPNPLSGYSFYRLKQTDYDGHYSYSEVQTVKTKGGSALQEALDVKSVFPNPFIERIGMNVILKEAGLAKLILQNEAGKEISSRTIEVTEGYNTVDFDNLGDLPKGIYFITIQFKDLRITKNIVKS